MIAAREMKASDIVEFVRNPNVSMDVAVEMVEKWSQMIAAQRVADELQRVLMEEES